MATVVYSQAIDSFPGKENKEGKGIEYMGAEAVEEGTETGEEAMVDEQESNSRMA